MRLIIIIANKSSTFIENLIINCKLSAVAVNLNVCGICVGGEAGAARAVRGNVWCEWRKQFGPGKPGGSADAPETSKSAVG